MKKSVTVKVDFSSSAYEIEKAVTAADLAELYDRFI